MAIGQIWIPATGLRDRVAIGQFFLLSFSSSLLRSKAVFNIYHDSRTSPSRRKVYVPERRKIIPPKSGYYAMGRQRMHFAQTNLFICILTPSKIMQSR